MSSTSRILSVMFGSCLFVATCSPEVDYRLSATPDDPNLSGTLVSRTYTSLEDFEGGGTDTLGVSVDPAGQLQIAGGLNLFQTPFIWIPNSTDRTIQSVDTLTLEASDPIPLIDANGETCYNPSRTTVDLEGNVWVGCRGDASYLNREQVTPDMIPVQVDTKVMKISKTDGSIMLSIKVGHAPRAMAIDANNHVWVGSSVDDSVWEIDGNTGHCYTGDAPECDRQPAIAVGDFPYGAAVDRRGHLWVVTFRDDMLAEIDTVGASLLGNYGPFQRATGKETYGIAIDQFNNIWLGGWTCSDVVKVKGVAGVNPADGITYAAGEMIASYSSHGKNARGVAIDMDGNVWVANSGTNNVVKLQNATGALVRDVTVGNSPIGVGVDANGNVWAVNRGGNSVHRINGLNGALSDEIFVGRGPYSYSDMLGMALRTITTRPDNYGYWRVVLDTEIEAPTWDSLSWSAAHAGDTDVQARFRCAQTQAELATAAWGPLLAEPGSISCPVQNARFGETELRLFPSSSGASPVVDYVTMLWRE